MKDISNHVNTRLAKHKQKHGVNFFLPCIVTINSNHGPNASQIGLSWDHVLGAMWWKNIISEKRH